MVFTILSVKLDFDNIFLKINFNFIFIFLFEKIRNYLCYNALLPALNADLLMR